MTALRLITAPAVEPVTLEEAKTHLTVTISSDDGHIQELITAARTALEDYSWRAFVSQQWEWSLDQWPATDVIKVPKPPLQSIDSIFWYDEDDVATEITEFSVDTASQPGRLQCDWPGDKLRKMNGLIITFTAGYGDTADLVPAKVKAAVKLTLGDLYNSEGDHLIGQGVSVAAARWSSKYLMGQVRMKRF